MTTTGNTLLWELWTEAAKETEDLGDPFFLECLEAVSSSRIFEELADDKLKTSLSIINSCLNDPKTRAKGLTLLSDVSSQINPSRLVGYQDAITSALHLVVKGLDSPLANTVLANLLPKCHSLSEVNQTITSSIVPKILSYICGDRDSSGGNNSLVSSQRSLEELMLLKTCLLEYHGPCGQFRDKLERNLVRFVDSENIEIVEAVGEIFPLLSYSGGGGNAGEKHSKDWNVMLSKFLKEAYSILYELYGDNSSLLESENPFDGEVLLGYKNVSENKVLKRMSLHKRRLLNILTILTGYLGTSFPAPKLVPQKGILKLLQVLTSVNPIPAKKSSITLRKENVYLSGIVPGIHLASLALLRSLFYCVGTNAFVDGITIEQLLTSEFKWILERPNAFENMRIQLYETLITWLTIAGGIVTNPKTLSVWVNVIGCDSLVEKDIVELKVAPKSKLGKTVQVKKSLSTSMSINPASITATTSQTYVQKSSDVCQIALKSLTSLIPSLDGENHKKVYEHLIKTASILASFNLPPSPYNNPTCRLLVFEALTRMAYSPQPQSPMSLTLIVSILRQGLMDTTKLVSSFCSCQISNLERLMHPLSAPLVLAGPVPAPVSLDNQVSSRVLPLAEPGNELSDEESVTIEDEEPVAISTANAIDDQTNTRDTFTPTPLSLGNQSFDINSLHSIIKKSVEEALKNHPMTSNLNQIPVNQTKLAQSVYGTSSLPLDFPISQNGIGKGHNDTIDDIDEIGDQQEIRETQATLITQSTPNGISHCSNVEDNEVSDHELRDIVVDFDNEIVVGSKRKNQPSLIEDEIDRTETLTKKAKSSSISSNPSKPVSATASVIEGPSVQEMMDSFIDLEPSL